MNDAELVADEQDGLTGALPTRQSVIHDHPFVREFSRLLDKVTVERIQIPLDQLISIDPQAKSRTRIRTRGCSNSIESKKRVEGAKTGRDSE